MKTKRVETKIERNVDKAPPTPPAFKKVIAPVEVRTRRSADTTAVRTFWRMLSVIIEYTFRVLRLRSGQAERYIFGWLRAHA